MADDVVLPGTGDTIAADEIVGKKFQRMKLTIGADGANDGDVSAENPVPAIDNRAAMLLMQILQALISPGSYDSSQRRSRVTALIESGTLTTVNTVTTVSAVTALTDQTNIGGRPAQMLINQTNLSAWADCVRARIT
jgi:hypothetical protein